VSKQVSNFSKLHITTDRAIICLLSRDLHEIFWIDRQWDKDRLNC